MPKNKKGKKISNSTPKKVVKAKKISYSDQLKKNIRMRQQLLDATLLYNYHTVAFAYFHQRIKEHLKPNQKYRDVYWKIVPDGLYYYDSAQKYLQDYKAFLENEIKKIVEPYSVNYWLHLSRRIAPGTLDTDERPATVAICRNIVLASFQKYGKLDDCGNIKLSTEISLERVFNGLFLSSDFKEELEVFRLAPSQMVLTNFDENNLLEYYDLERLAFEMWFAGSKARVIAKGGNLLVDHRHEQILLDDRTPILQELIENYDNRTHSMEASATGTVFTKVAHSGIKQIILTQLVADRSASTYSHPITDLVGLHFANGGFPNFEFATFDIAAYLKAHMAYADVYYKKWNVRLEYVIAIITDICIAIAHEIVNEKNLVVTGNLVLRSYRTYPIEEYVEGMKKNWANVETVLGIQLPYDEQEVKKTMDYLTLSEENRKDIHIVSFGPLKPFIKSSKSGNIIIDISVFQPLLFNLFYDLPLQDTGFKGQLLEDAIQSEKSYLPVTESKALDGSSKQVDYSIARGDILILAECKAVATSFGIFTGQSSAQQHRIRNVIDKGLNDIDKKVEWFLKHPQGTNYDISNFKYIVGVAVSAFVEFIHSKEDKYWLNEKLPRVLTIAEFEQLIKSDVKKVIKKNLHAIK